MDPIFEYFYEIHGLSLLGAFFIGTFGSYIRFNLNRRRNRIRSHKQSPLWLRIKSKLNQTGPGKLNLKTHLMWENFRNKHAHKLLFNFNQKLSYLFVRKSLYALGWGLLGGFYYAEIFGGFRYENSYYVFQSPEMDATRDRVKLYMKSVKSKTYTNDILGWELVNKLQSEKFDLLDYLEFGKLMSGALQEEIAFQCYYMAYLKDPENMKTNADMNFDTLIFKNEN